jgi:hypothetical protein
VEETSTSFVIYLSIFWSLVLCQNNVRTELINVEICAEPSDTHLDSISTGPRTTYIAFCFAWLQHTRLRGPEPLHELSLEARPSSILRERTSEEEHNMIQLGFIVTSILLVFNLERLL